MKAEEFFAVIRDQLLDHRYYHWWSNDYEKIIRVEFWINPRDKEPLRSSRSYSPITAVCRLVTGKHFPVRQWPAAAAALGLNHKFAQNMALAQDTPMRLLTGRARKYRRLLLEMTDVIPPSLF